MFFRKSHDKSHFQELEPTTVPNVGCFSHQVAHPPAPAWSPNQCPSNNVPDEADISGWWQFVQQENVGWIPWGWALRYIWENPTWRKACAITYIYVMMIRIGTTSNQSLVFTNLYIYIISIFRDHPSSEHTIFHIIKALPQLPWDPETQTTHHPDGRTSLFSQQLEAGRAQLWVMAVKIPPRNWWCQWGVKIHLLLGKTWVYRSNTD